MNARTRGIYVRLRTTSYVIIPHLTFVIVPYEANGGKWQFYLLRSEDWGVRRWLFLVGLCIICAPAHSLDLRSPHFAPFPPSDKMFVLAIFWPFLRVIVSHCQRELGVDKFQTQDIYRYFVGYKYFATKPNITIGNY